MATISIQITDGDWDAHEADDGSGFSSSGVNLRCEASTTDSARYNAGMYFPNVTLPADATVDDARVKVVFPASSRDSPDLDWYFNDVDDADDFSTTADVTSRARTSASVNWSDSNLGSGSHVDSPDLATLVSEVQARGGWASGQAMAAIAAGENGAAAESGCRFTPYDNTPADACILNIQYTPAAAGGGPLLGGGILTGGGTLMKGRLTG